VEEIVRHGRGQMPAFALSTDDLNRLRAFLFSKAPVAPVESDSEKTKTATSTPTRYRSGFGFMSTSSGLSPIAPPWTTLTAYDLNEGTIKWQIPLGEVPELAAKGIKNTGAHFPKLGPVVTAGGLIFTGTRDRKVRALDEETGEVLWEAELPTALEGIPAVFESGGQEYIVFCAAAQSNTKLLNAADPGTSQAKSHDGAYVAFALPRS
jgi:quinoprotein glucose dehydrogenase